jgi:hypothetical protein
VGWSIFTQCSWYGFILTGKGVMVGKVVGRSRLKVDMDKD